MHGYFTGNQIGSSSSTQAHQTEMPAMVTTDSSFSTQPHQKEISALVMTGSSSSTQAYETEIPDLVTTSCQTEIPILVTTGCQTDETLFGLQQLQDDLQSLRSETLHLHSKVKSLEISEDSFKDDDAKVTFFTGLHNFAILMHVFNFLTDTVTHSPNCLLTLFQEFVLFVMHLRLNVSFQYLAYRFGVSPSTVARIFTKWVDLAYLRLKNCIRWPAREELRFAMPPSFRRNFGDRVSVILDCFEIKMNTPSSLLAKAATWSYYKNNNTIKFLIGISPNGSISFISRGWGGRVSDKTITENCSILENLLPGDIVLADRGFGIEDSVGLYCASLARPAFTKGKPQLSPLEVETTRKLANVRIHVERVIGLVRRKYKILQGPLPVEFVKGTDDSETKLDKIVRICCALVNYCPNMVPLS